MNKEAQAMMINLLILGMTIMVLVAFAPAINSTLSVAQQSDGLNCDGYVHNGNENHSLSYNSSLNTNTMACLSIRMYLPYIFLAVLIGGAQKLFTNRVFTPDQGAGGYQ
jgi:hypothetical protein